MRKLSFFRDNLKPVSVRICYKIYAHIVILESDAAHALMQLMCSFEIICMESKVELFLAEVILLRMLCEPCQFQFK